MHGNGITFTNEGQLWTDQNQKAPSGEATDPRLDATARQNPQPGAFVCFDGTHRGVLSQAATDAGQRPLSEVRATSRATHLSRTSDFTNCGKSRAVELQFRSSQSIATTLMRTAGSGALAT